MIIVQISSGLAKTILMTDESNNGANSPSVGPLIERYLKDHRIYKAALTRALNITEVYLRRQRKRDDASISWLWKLSNALHHNFIADIAVLLPPDYSGGLQDAIAAKEKEIESLKSELEAVAKERDIYKDLLKK